MADREKVIKAIDICLGHGHCNDCEYHSAGHYTTQNCRKQMMIDVLVLLKEQGPKTQGADSGMCEICSFYERAMPVKPHYNARTNWYECGACHYSMTSGMHCRSELIPAYKVGFCAKCGKPVEWNV